MSINGREAQKRRDGSKRLHLDIQAETVIKPLATACLLVLLTFLTNQS
jgi:hypothetical protein